MVDIKGYNAILQLNHIKTTQAIPFVNELKVMNLSFDGNSSRRNNFHLLSFVKQD